MASQSVAKKAVLLSFRLNDMVVMGGGASHPDAGRLSGGIRCLQNSAAGTLPVLKPLALELFPDQLSESAFIAPSVVLMPSFVNLGAYVDKGTMVDTWATVGSCAQIGKNVHLSGGAGIGACLNHFRLAR